ncbi:winged helix-turn-helix domain-containing protein [Klebsiella pneumoniae]|uniref:winged helix-turn-helix domain-containing protein n=1 Tax=Klebsiella pneumoniae TaxID=573 RepID=UPI002166EFC1|nr:winged helix-turn-helix domain-containing protein [Klebsiella pneumoniae]
MYWIINKNIEFWPENKRLISLKNPAQSVTLTAPASHCLVLLLEATPELVSQQVFFKKVWEDEGILVPANTLYQNISIVRRGLRDVGETDNSIVVTVPQKAFISILTLTLRGWMKNL